MIFGHCQTFSFLVWFHCFCSSEFNTFLYVKETLYYFGTFKGKQSKRVYILLSPNWGRRIYAGFCWNSKAMIGCQVINVDVWICLCQFKRSGDFRLINTLWHSFEVFARHIIGNILIVKGIKLKINQRAFRMLSIMKKASLLNSQHRRYFDGSVFGLNTQ